MEPLQDNKRFQGLLTHMNEAVWMGDDNERIIYANPKFCEIVEYSLEEMLGLESYVFWDKESAKTVKRVNNDDRKKGVSSSYQGILVSKSGKKTPVLLSGTPLPDGGTIGIMTDLSQLKKSEANALLLGRAIEQSHDGVLITNKKGEILFSNSGCESIFGYKSKDVLGKTLSDIVIYPQENLLQEKYFEKEMNARHKNGDELSIHIVIYEQIQEENIVYVCIIRNVGPAQRMQRDLLDNYEKIRSAFNAFGTLRRKMDYLFDLLTESQKKDQTLQSLGNYIVTSLIMFSHADACLLRIKNKENFEVLSSFGFDDGWMGKKVVKIEKSLAFKAYLDGTYVRILDIATSPDYQTKHLALKNNLHALVAFPLAFQGEMIGSLSLYLKSNKNFNLLEDDFLVQYKKMVEFVLGIFYKSSRIDEMAQGTKK